MTPKEEEEHYYKSVEAVLHVHLSHKKVKDSHGAALQLEVAMQLLTNRLDFNTSDARDYCTRELKRIEAADKEWEKL